MFMNGNAGKRLLTVIALTLLIAFVLSTTSAQAWPWRKVWLTFLVHNNTGHDVNGIIIGGFNFGYCTSCVSYPSHPFFFPSCYGSSVPIFMWGILSLHGYYYGKSTVYPPPLNFKVVGVGCWWCAGITGAGVWLEDWVPRGWFQTCGLKCTSPVILTIDDSLPRPVTVANVEFACVAEPIPFDSFSYDYELPYEPADMPPESLLYPGDSIEVIGIFPEDVGDSTVVIRAQLIALVDAEGRGSFWDTVYFAAQIMPCCNGDGIRGNADDIVGPGGEIDVADLTYLVNYLFKSGPVPPCMEEGNIDGIIGVGGPIDVADLTYLVAYLFKSGPAPALCP